MCYNEFALENNTISRQNFPKVASVFGRKLLPMDALIFQYVVVGRNHTNMKNPNRLLCAPITVCVVLHKITEIELVVSVLLCCNTVFATCLLYYNIIITENQDFFYKMFILCVFGKI